MEPIHINRKARQGESHTCQVDETPLFSEYFDYTEYLEHFEEKFSLPGVKKGKKDLLGRLFGKNNAVKTWLMKRSGPPTIDT